MSENNNQLLSRNWAKRQARLFGRSGPLNDGMSVAALHVHMALTPRAFKSCFRAYLNFCVLSFCSEWLFYSCNSFLFTSLITLLPYMLSKTKGTDSINSETGPTQSRVLHRCQNTRFTTVVKFDIERKYGPTFVC